MFEVDLTDDFKEEVFRTYVNYLYVWHSPNSPTFNKDKLARAAINNVYRRESYKFKIKEIRLEFNKEEYIKYLISFNADELVVLEKV